jgi:hypothetical protein
VCQRSQEGCHDMNIHVYFNARFTLRIGISACSDSGLPSRCVVYRCCLLMPLCRICCLKINSLQFHQ